MLAGDVGQTREVASQPGHGKIHEGSDLRHGEPAVRRNQMHRQRRRFVVCKNNLERTVAYLISNLK